VIGGLGSARLPRRWRAAFVVVSVAASAPVFALAGSAAAHGAAALAIVAQAAALWWLSDRPWLGTAVVLVAGAALQLMFP